MRLLQYADRLVAMPVRFTYTQPSLDWTIEGLINLALQAGDRTLEIRFSDADCLSADNLGSLLVVRKKISAQGGRLVLSCMDEQIRELFAITRLDRAFEILGEDEPDAFDLMTQSPTI